MAREGILLLILCCLFPCMTTKQPHIVFIVADDLGWNDVGFRNPDMITPNIDKLAQEGVIFNSSYVLPVCSPSRSAFMSGLYPFKTGFQHYVIGNSQNTCLPHDLTLLPQQMKKAGYSTHAIGKWHLGYCNWNCTPTYKGFDTFFGYYNGAEDYFQHTMGPFYDLRDNEKIAWDQKGKYSAQFFAERASDIIKQHDTQKPLFMYLPFQNVHAPIQVPQKYSDLYPNVVNSGRKRFSGMVTALDEAIGNITKSLQDRKMLEDTLILFTADNGGELVAYANNWPLRGGKVRGIFGLPFDQKHTLWEGGTRATAFMRGYGIQNAGTHYNGMIHAVDWMPTLIGIAGGKQVPGIDGINQWDSIRMNQPSKRTEFIYNLDDFFIPSQGHAAIREGDLKLILGYPGLYDGWYKQMNDTKDTALYNFIYTPGDTPARLFNIKDDPQERNDISALYPDTVDLLIGKINVYRASMVPANFPKPDPMAHTVAKRNGGAWSPGWC